MKNNIDTQLEKVISEKRIGVMTHVVIGYPTIETTLDLVRTMAESGVDLIELQIPFSDPLADGPTIQQACEASLASGIKVADAFKVARQASTVVQIPLLFMAYFNTVYKYGIEKFCADAEAAGITGLIVPDVPLEAAEHEGFLVACKRHNLHYIITLSPTSTSSRIKKNASIAGGFAYCTARVGATGAGGTLDSNITSYLQEVRKEITVPLAVGFGISKREHLDMLAPYASVAVIGSAIIDVMNRAAPSEALRDVRAFLEALQSTDASE